MARDALRSATRASHDAVDALFGKYDLSIASSYGAFLRAHAIVLSAAEAWLDQHQRDMFLEWSRARRTPALLADLKELGIAPPAVDQFEMPDDAASVAGVTYVIEGSRLGGAILAKRVPAGLPRAYLGSMLVMPLWRQFLDDLERTLDTPGARNSAARAAVMTFDRFHEAGKLAQP